MTSIICEHCINYIKTKDCQCGKCKYGYKFSEYNEKTGEYYCKHFKSRIPNLIEAKCCGTCKYTKWFYEGEVECTKYDADIMQFNLCDSYESEGSYDKSELRCSDCEYYEYVGTLSDCSNSQIPIKQIFICKQRGAFGYDNGSRFMNIICKGYAAIYCDATPCETFKPNKNITPGD